MCIRDSQRAALHLHLDGLLAKLATKAMPTQMIKTDRVTVEHSSSVDAVGGGLAAGIGSALYDLTNPAYIASAPFTFAFKFMLACVCGLVAYAGNNRGKNHKLNIAAAVCGSVTYMILYLGKNFVEGLLLGSEMGTVLTALATKLFTSSVNAVIAVVVSVPLYAAIRLALKKSKLLDKMNL